MTRTLARLAVEAPHIPIPASAFEVDTASGPTGFHERLRAMIRGARRRLTLAALYLGTEPSEQALVDDIRSALERSPDLAVQLVFDYSRGQRATTNGTSTTVVRELLAAYPRRVELHLHRMPQLDGLARLLLPSPLDEVLGVFHCKGLASDDTALLTGANLSGEYFSCRQARSVTVRHPAFAAMLHDLIGTTARHSHRVRVGGEGSGLAPPERSRATLPGEALGLFTTGPRAGPDEETVLVPLLQHPRLGLRQEYDVLREVLAWTHGELTISTPYANFSPDYVRALTTRVAGGGRTLLITPSGRSHSFTTGRGAKALVPGVYAHREAQCVAPLRAASADGAFQLRHYDRPDWVFHAKGLWFRTEHETATVIGSSSFGGRSVGRDFDASFLVVTRSPALRAALEAEVGALLEFAPHEQPPRAGSWVAPLLAPLVKRFM
jgi:CDP-diacylglycerol---glycerol-3-phosphate 3-phosphatidyltransferase